MGTADGSAMMPLLQAVLHVPPPAVDLVDRLGLLGQVGHHKARIVLRAFPNPILLCVADFYVDPHHDAARVRQALEVVAASSPYRLPDSPITVVVLEKPWGTHYRVKVYVQESRNQVSITSDLTVCGKAALLGMGIKAARVPVAEAGA